MKLPRITITIDNKTIKVVEDELVTNLEKKYNELLEEIISLSEDDKLILVKEYYKNLLNNHII